MIKVKKNWIYLLSQLVLLALTPFLSGQTDEQVARFEEEKIAFFTKELQLTEAESEKFWPLYNDFNNRIMKISEDERNTLRYFHGNMENLSDQEVSDMLAKYLDLNNQKHKLELEYHKKFREILPDQKVMMMYVAERQFRMHLIRKLKEPGQGQGPGPGQGGRQRGGKGPGGGAMPFPDDQDPLSY